MWFVLLKSGSSQVTKLRNMYLERRSRKMASAFSAIQSLKTTLRAKVVSRQARAFDRSGINEIQGWWALGRTLWLDGRGSDVVSSLHARLEPQGRRSPPPAFDSPSSKWWRQTHWLYRSANVNNVLTGKMAFRLLRRLFPLTISCLHDTFRCTNMHISSTKDW